MFNIGDIVEGPNNAQGKIIAWHDTGDYVFAKVISLDFGFVTYYWLASEMTKLKSNLSIN